MALHISRWATSCSRMIFHRSLNHSQRWEVRVTIEDELNNRQYSLSIDHCASLYRCALWFPLASVELRIPIRTAVDSPSFPSSNVSQWSVWSRFLRGMWRKGWYSSCVTASEREVWMNYVSLQILRDRLLNDAWLSLVVAFWFLELIRSLVRNRLPFFISLASLCVDINSFIHLHRYILADMPSGGIFITWSASLDDHLRSFRATFRIGGWRREFLYFTHLLKVVRSLNRWFDYWREILIW